MWMSIYLKEAHAQDVWPLGQHYCINDHKTLQDRIAGAEKFLKKFAFKVPMVVDCMENEFLFAYLAHPERFYGFFGANLEFKAQPIEANYPLFQLRDWLKGHFMANPDK